jgi:hypothetical protein
MASSVLLFLNGDSILYPIRLYIWNDQGNLTPNSAGIPLYANMNSQPESPGQWNEFSIPDIILPDTFWIGLCYNYLITPPDWYLAYNTFMIDHHTYINCNGGPNDWSELGETGLAHPYGVRVYVTDVLIDVYPISIDISSPLPEGTILSPQATVKNIGVGTETFDVTCEINPGGYSSTETVTDLAPGDSFQITFSPDFTFATGSYTVTVYTQLPGDVNSVNDTLEKIIETHDPGVTEGYSDRFVQFSFGLQNNPAHGHAVFNLALSEPATVRLTIYDVSGRLVDEVLSEKKAAGYYSIPWTKDVKAGIYFYSFTSARKNSVGKFVLIR